MVEKENVMARRGENIHKRTDGRWEGRYMLSTPTGRKQRSVYAKTYAKVKEKLAVAKETAKKESFAIDAERGRDERRSASWPKNGFNISRRIESTRLT